MKEGLLVSALLVVVLAPSLAFAEDVEPPVIEHQPITEAVADRPLLIRARIADPSGVFAPSVYVRAIGMDSRFVTIAMRRSEADPEAFEATVPASRVQRELHYFIEAFDELGNGPARVGTPDAPLVVREVAPLPEVRAPPVGVAVAEVVTPAEKDEDGGGVLGSWWFWTLVGAAVVGGAAAGVWALSDTGPRDEFTVEIRGPDPAAGL